MSGAEAGHRVIEPVTSSVPGTPARLLAKA